MKTNSRGLSTALVLGFVLAFGSLASGQSQSDRQARAERLTQALASLNFDYYAAGHDERPSVLTELRAAAAERRQLLLSMIESDPGQVLRVALSPELRASVPAAVRDLVEQHVQLEGTLEVLQEDHAHSARLLHVLHADGARFALTFASKPPGLLTGDRVRVRGVRLDDTLALESGATSLETISAATALPNTFGEQRTLVMLVNFQDAPVEPYSPAYASDVVFGATSDYNLEASYQQTWLAGDVLGWFTIAMNSTVCDTATLASLAKQAATGAGADLSLYTRYVYAFPQNACSWWGLGTVGGNPSQAWINSNLTYRVVAHELGHNLGLHHAHSLDCGASPIEAPCTSGEYGDKLDMMGAAYGHVNAFMKERLGWLAYGASPPITTVETDGLYGLEPVESIGGTAKALKILKSTDATTGARTWYYVEFRQAVGFDSFLGTYGNVLNGVLIHTGSESGGNTSYLLDMTPETESWNDPALEVGKSFTDATAGVTMTTASASSAGASVAVSFSAPACVRGNPSVGLSPPQSAWVTAGTLVRYTVSVTNTDSPACAAASFDLAATAPSGWTADFGSPALTIGPGSIAATTLEVTSASTAADGSHAVGVVAANAFDLTKSGSASATYIVASSLTVQVSTDQASYARNQTVSITARIWAGSSVASGASVTFTITKPDGSVVTGTASAGDNGFAVYSLRLRGKPSPGIYQLSAAAGLNGVSGSGATSFTIE